MIPSFMRGSHQPVPISRRNMKSGMRPCRKRGRSMDINNNAQPAAVAGNATTTQAILEAVHLRKYFPLRQLTLFGKQLAVHAVEDNSLALYPGRALALVGESGSGK